MPNKLVDLYRQKLAESGATDDRDDYFITQDFGKLAQQEAPQLFQAFPDFASEYQQIRDANAPSLAGEFTQALKSGTKETAATYAGLGALATGSDKLKDVARGLEESAQENAPTIPTLQDINPGETGPSKYFSKDAARYVISKAGGAIPSLAEMAALATAGGLAGSAVEPGVGSVAGAAEGALEAALGRGIIKNAIRSIVEKGVVKGATEDSIVTAIKGGDTALADAVTQEAKAMAAGRASDITNLANVYGMSAGGIYNETGRPDLALGLGAAAALTAAPPVISLPGQVVRTLFPRLSGPAAAAAGEALVGKRTAELLAKLGRAGVATGAGTTGVVGMEAANIVAKNITQGKDPLNLDPEDWSRLREAAIGGAIGSLPFAALATRTPESTTITPRGAAPAAEEGLAPPPAPLEPVTPAAPAPAARTAAVIYREVNAMTPEQKTARLGELQNQPSRTPEEESEFQLLQATAPAPEPSPEAAPPAVAAPTEPVTVPSTEVPQPETPPAPEAPPLGIADTPIPAPGAPEAPPAAPEPVVPPATGTPEYRYTVQQPQDHPAGTGKIPGYVQIDEIVNGQNTRSSNLEALRKEGIDLPDVPADLPTGQYTLDQIKEAAAKPPTVKVGDAVGITEIPKVDPAKVVTTGEVPKPADLPPVVPSTEPVPPAPGDRLAAAADGLQGAAVPFEHGAIIEGAPSLDFRSVENKALTPEQWEATLRANAANGVRGAKTGNRAETRIGVALRAPDGRIILAGLVTPQKTLNERGFFDHNAFALQRMGVREEGKRVVKDGGDSPALIREVVKAGYEPVAVIHFNEEPGKIFQTFDNEPAFDAAWGASDKTSRSPVDTIAHAPKSQPEVRAAVRSEQQIQAEIDRLGAKLETAKTTAEKDQLTGQVIMLYDELNEAIARGQSQSGDTALRQAAIDQQMLPVHAARAGEFQAVASRLKNMGGRVDLFAQEFFAQGTKEVISKQIQDLQAKLDQATTRSQKNVLQHQIDVREERLSEIGKAQGATFTPWHIAISMQDVQNANLGNLVTLLHEAAESLTMRLNPAVRGKVIHAIEESMTELREKAQAAADKNGVGLAKETGAADLLAETLGQKLAAEGIPESSNMADAIVRWVKDLYYRVSMAAQRAFGREPDPDTSLAWYENQLRREVLGDYDYRMGRMLDKYMLEPLSDVTRRFTGHGQTPGGVVDYLDPIATKLRQPWVEPTTQDALAWNVAFRQDGTSPGGDEIPEAEARARIDTASLNEVNDFATKLHVKIGNGIDWARFWKIVGRGEDPRILVGAQEARQSGSSKAVIGGERMTDNMNGLSRLGARILMEKLHLRAIRELAKANESSATEGEKLVDAAKAVNKIESDFRNASLHEETLRSKAKEMVRSLVRAYSRGMDTAEMHGELAEAVRHSEGLLESDPIPESYQKVFKSLLDGDTPIFDYMKGIAGLDLSLSEMTPNEIVKAIQENGDSNPALARLAENRPLATALAVLAKSNADQVDEIQLGWLRDTEKFKAIHDELKAIRGANDTQLKDMIRKMEERAKAVGLRERIKVSYLKRRRALRTASDRIQRSDERSELLKAAIPEIGKKVEELQSSGSTAPSDWYARNGATWTALSQDADGKWSRQTRTLQFKPDGSAVDSEGIRSAIVSNMDWLRQNQAKAGSKFYETVKRQTTELGMLDVQRKYHAGWVNMVDRWVQPLGAEAMKAGGAAGARIQQMLNQFQFITRSHGEEVAADAHWWTKALTDVEAATGIADHGDFFRQIYDPVMYFLNTNPGLGEDAAIRHATRLARARLTKEPAANFNEKFAEFLRRTKTASEKTVNIAEQYGAFVKDPRLKSELRRAVAQGWLTSMRSIRGDVVQTIIRDMEKAGWKLKMKDVEDSKGQVRSSVVRAGTFDDLTTQDTSEKNTAALNSTLQPYFTPGIIQRWLEPFLNKTGKEIFTWRHEPIAQADVQAAWDGAGNNVLQFIDALAKRVKLGAPEAETGGDPLADFRLSMLNQIDRLFGMESKIAYDSAQTRNLFDPMGPKPHVVMDARMNDLIPPEHLQFQAFDPTSARILLGQLAFHSAFGRNGEKMVSAVNELKSSTAARRQEYQSLTGTTRNQRVAEAAARGWDYKELERAAQRYDDVAGLQAKLEGLFGANNPAGPFHDLRGGMEVLHAMVGQIVDNPKTALYNVLSLFERPFAQRSLGPNTVRATAGAAGEFLKTALGGMLESMNLHLLHSSDYAKEIAGAEGASYRNLPWGVALSDIGQRGKFQSSKTDRYLIKPLRMLRYIQRKGVKVGIGAGEREFPRFTAIPGLGVMNSIMQSAAVANSMGVVRQMESLVKRGISHYAANKDDAQNPSFRFSPKNLGMGGLDQGVYDWFRNKSVEYGMGNLEDIVRNAMPAAAKGERLLTKDQVLRLSMMALNELDGQASINTSPSVLQTNPILRIGMPLLRWPLWKMHQIHEGMSTAEGQKNFVSVMKGLGTLAAWNLPVGIAFSLMLDQYDEKLLHKKANIRGVDPTAAIPLIGPALALANGERSIPDNLLGFLQRGARAGNLYGLGADLATGLVAPFDPNSGQRTVSLDQRVLVMSQLLNLKDAMVSLTGQDWTTTWASFWRPFVTSLGGNGALHAMDLMNNALGLDNAESRVVSRINAGNWLRSAAQEADMELRPTASVAATPTLLSMWSREMLTAAMANDRAGFMDAHRNALDAARKLVTNDPRIAIADREKEAEQRVLAAWRGRDPLDVFRFKPTPAQLAHVYSIMDDSGRDDVRDAITRYQNFTRMIQPSVADRQVSAAVNRLTKVPTFRQMNPGGMSLFSSR